MVLTSFTWGLYPHHGPRSFIQTQPKGFTFYLSYTEVLLSSCNYSHRVPWSGLPPADWLGPDSIYGCFFQPIESFMLTEFELSPASLLWTCPAIAGPEPNCDLQIDFPAWTWICLIILILLYDLGYYLDSTAISRPVLLVLLGYLQDWGLVGEAPASCVILLSSLTCRKQPCSCCSLTQGISEFLHFSFCYFILNLF